MEDTTYYTFYLNTTLTIDPVKDFERRATQIRIFQGHEIVDADLVPREPEKDED